MFFYRSRGANFNIFQVDDDAEECSYFNKSTKKAMWIPQSGSKVYLRPKELSIGESQYQLVSDKGMAVSRSCVVFNEKYDTDEKRKKAVENLSRYLNAVARRQHYEYDVACKKYRISRREWKIAVVKREWLTRKNHKLFRPGTTTNTVNCARRKGELDNQREEDGDFPLHYLGDPAHLVATSKDGQKVLPTNASKHISLEGEA